MDIPHDSALRFKLSLSSSDITTERRRSTSSQFRNQTMSSSSYRSKPTIYFGYGSNLWLHQMRLRCPTSEYLGIARLRGYKWIIYDRGYANIVEIEDEGDEKEERREEGHDYTKEVWGLVYSLEEKDEARLDVNEGVPIAYTKEWIECEFWASSNSREIALDTATELAYSAQGRPDTSKTPEKVDMLVYINRKQVKETDPKKEYVYRMNMGIRDAVKEGVPREYVEQVMRRFIPDVEDKEAEKIARRQALEFEDER